MTPKSRSLSLFEKSSRSILGNVDTWQKFVDSTRDLKLENNEGVHVAVLGSKLDLFHYLKSAGVPGVHHLTAAEGLSLFSYQRRFGRVQRHSTSGMFLLSRTAHAHVYILLFVAESRFWRYGILPLIESLYPNVLRPFLTQHELYGSLKHIQREAHPRGLRVLEFSSKKRLGASSRKKFQSIREWTDTDLDSVYRDAREQNIWFRSVTFDLAERRNGAIVSTGTRGVLSKYSYFSCTREFYLFEKTIVRDLVDYAAARIKFFSNRERSSTPSHVAKPLQIVYETEVFKSVDQSKAFVEALRRFRHGTCTILHANPYLHLSIVDNIDYSSADLWVLARNKILLVPQIRASEAALKRIVNHIFENFREGSISEYKDQT